MKRFLFVLSGCLFLLCTTSVAYAQKAGLRALARGTSGMVKTASVGNKALGGGIASPAWRMGVERLITGRTVNLAQQTAWQSSFRVRAPKDEEAVHSFSGTLFQLGQETYGAIATHALVYDKTPNIGRWLLADVFLDGQWTTVPAQVVQLSAPATWDVALVKFRPQDAVRLKPLPLRTRPLQLGDEIRVTGFHHQEPLVFSGQRISEISPFSIRAPITGISIQRIGLCGAAVTDAQGELVGVHTGSKFGFEGDIGYATHAQILPKLVEAFGNNEPVFWTLEINGQKITDLRLDEYVYTIEFMDAQGELVDQLAFNGKFSYREVEEMLARYPQVRQLKLSTAYVSWQKENPNLLKVYTPARKLTYDLQMQRIVE